MICLPVSATRIYLTDLQRQGMELMKSPRACVLKSIIVLFRGHVSHRLLTTSSYGKDTRVAHS